MFRIIFLILVLLSSAAFTQTDEKALAEKTDDFGFVTIEHFQALLDSFIQHDLFKDSSTRGLIVNYGSDRQIRRNELITKGLLSDRRFDSSKIVLVKGGFLKEPRTEFWLVPEGADPPKILLKPRKFDEFGKINNSDLNLRFTEFIEEVEREETSTGYIINYGSSKEINRIEKLMTKHPLMNRRMYDPVRIVFVNGGESEKLKTVLWIVPAGAKPPTP